MSVKSVARHTVIDTIINERKAADLFNEALTYLNDANRLYLSDYKEAKLRHGFYRDTAKRLQRYIWLAWGQYLMECWGVTEDMVHVCIVELFGAVKA